MKDKQEQIEEMVSILEASNNPFVDVPIEIMTNVTEALYNAGYRKVPDGATVLLIGENNQALDEKTIEYFVKHNADVRKETAKEFAEKLKEKFDEQKHFYETASISHRDISLTALYAAYKYLDETLKEYEK